MTQDLEEALRVGDAWARIDAGRLCAYDSRGEFVADPASGVAGEQACRQSIGDGKRTP